MCAIFGIVGPYDPQKAREAFALLSHRGPDGSGRIEAPELFLGHHRLALIDPLPEADQPMRVGDTFGLFNGEIYNYRELRETLGGAFLTQSDTEVLIRAFMRWGQETPRHLRGMYAVAFWHEKALWLFRDPFGKKPLYYAHVGQTLVFASEARAVTAYLDATFEKDRLKAYLFYQTVLSPRSFYRDIFQLEPGAALRFQNGRLTRYPPSPLPTSKPGRTLSKKSLTSLLRQAVSRRLVADAPLGALLSGGVDSSLVAALAIEERPKLPTFTVGYEGYEKYDERPYAGQVARHIGSDHREFVMDQTAFLESVEALIDHLDEPLADPAAVPLWFLARKIAQTGIKGVLSGDGADELFFGYRPYYEIIDVEKAADLKYRNWLRNYFRAHYSPNKEWEWYKRAFEKTPVFRGSGELFSDLQQNLTLKQNVKDDTSLEAIEHLLKNYGQPPEGAGWMSYIDLKTQLAEVYLKKLDRVLMAHGLEGRSPFLDYDLAETLLSTDAMWRMGERPKWLLKSVAAAFLPPDILERKKKGFSYPYMEWLFASGEIARIEDLNQKYRLFRPDALRFYIERAQKGRFKHQLYALWFYLRWLDRL